MDAVLPHKYYFMQNQKFKNINKNSNATVLFSVFDKFNYSAIEIIPLKEHSGFSFVLPYLKLLIGLECNKQACTIIKSKAFSASGVSVYRIKYRLNTIG